MRINSAVRIGLPFLLGVSTCGYVPAQEVSVRNASGLRIEVDSNDSNPALTVFVPDGPESERNSKILFPEHVTVRAHGDSAQKHL
jgi:hypothetical protein